MGSEPARLALSALLALGLHTALLSSVPIHWRQAIQPPAPLPFQIRLAVPEPTPVAAPVEPVFMAWLPPTRPAPFLPLANAPEPVQEPKPAPEPAVKSTPKPALKPAVKPTLKPPPVAKPTPKPAIQPKPQPRVESKPRPVASSPPKAAVTPKPAAPPVVRRSESPAPGQLDSAALLGQIASLETSQQRQASASTRTRRVSLTDTRSAAGFYAADWARKVTRVGETNFPDSARRLPTGAGPLLDVVIRADGQLQEVRVMRSSGYPELDQAARRIVERAAPYPPFPPELRRDVDLLRIEAPWRFDPGGRIRAR